MAKGDKALLRALWRSKYLLVMVLTLGTWEATQSFSHAKLLLPIYLWGIPVQVAALVGVLLWQRWRRPKEQAASEHVSD